MNHSQWPVRALWMVIGLLTVTAAVAGLVFPDIYRGVVAADLLPGAVSQDLMSGVAGIALIVLALTVRREQTKARLVALGILGYLFYAYGIYSIERTYNGFYLVYLAIFALSFWGVLYTAMEVRAEGPRRVRVPAGIRRLSATGALLQPLIFYPLWIAMLLPLMRTREQIDSLYSVFVLDLCFIMPAFLILAVLTFRGRWPGLVFMPALFLLGFTLIFSLALGELFKPLFKLPVSAASLWSSVLLSALFLVLGVLHLWKLELNPGGVGRRNRGSRPVGQHTGAGTVSGPAG
ncbi:hypothetical protein QK292_01180 [Arthrobacter sp. AL08]|uniref:hypothetical protein n=1 Tax=Micrococcaceae TaxID=1268 RepID=UPI00249A8FA1|nr:MULTISPECIES: hypothetical protein [Micrococcaceae]MDI3240176.1 hypothetical protein [Arthrobacter sp. AL05]MDI3276186.1 hypothetical protein [Arthrobacter sp. AL08]MDJ0353808.1 hypothetical protein [Pseudarthrobacter sp. PH31-O2]